MSRETALTDDVYRGILAAIRAGNDNIVAAGAQGVNEATFYRWMRRGAEDGPCIRRFAPSAASPAGALDWNACESGAHALGECPGNEVYREFREAVERAKHEFEVIMSSTIAKAAPTNPRYAMALLERRVPERWKPGRSADAQASRTSDAPLVIRLIEQNRPDAEFSQIERMLKVASSAADPSAS